MKLIHLISFTILILTISCTTNQFDFHAYDTEYSETYTNRNQEYLISNNSDIEIFASVKNYNDEYMFILSVGNSGNDSLYLDDSQIQLFQGNIDEHKWSPIKVYSAYEYYSKVKRVAGYSTNTHTNYFYDYQSGISGSIQTTIKSYDPYEANSILSDYEKLLFFPVKLPTNKSYTRAVYTKTGKGPDFKLSMFVEGEEHLFFFYRSDREEIIKPFLDKSRARHSVFYSYIPDRPYGINYSYNNSEGIGCFLGTNFNIPQFQGYDTGFYEVDRNGNPEYGDYTLTGDKTYFSIEGNIGINYKLLPYIWLNSGIGISYSREYYLAEETFLGDYWDTEWLRSMEYSVDFNPRVGIDIIAGPLFISPKFILEGLSQPSFEIGGGYSY